VEKWNKVIHREWENEFCGKLFFHRGKVFHREKGTEMEH
jgi:hypothetical protein